MKTLSLILIALACSACGRKQADIDLGMKNYCSSLSQAAYCEQFTQCYPVLQNNCINGNEPQPIVGPHVIH
jgi:hypothetical protein